MWRMLSDNPIDGGPVLRLSWKTRENAPAFKPGRSFALRNEALGLSFSSYDAGRGGASYPAIKARGA